MRTLTPRELTALALLVLTMVLWAGNSIIGRAVRDDIPPFTLSFLRWTGASLILLPLAWKGLRRDWPTLMAGWKPVLLLGLTGVAAFNALLYSGLQHTTATNALLLQAAIPPAVLLADWLLHRAQSPRLQKVGVAMSVLGIVVVVFEGEPSHLLTLRLGVGDVLILTAVFSWAFYTVWLRHAPKVAPLSFLAATFPIGIVAMAPLALFELLNGENVVWSESTFGALAYVSLLPSIVAFMIYNHATGVLGPARAGQAITLMPLFGAFLSAALLGERLHPYHFAGMALIGLGIALGAIAGRGQATGA